jgi:hypothetical protein
MLLFFVKVAVISFIFELSLQNLLLRFSILIQIFNHFINILRNYFFKKLSQSLGWVIFRLSKSQFYVSFSYDSANNNHIGVSNITNQISFSAQVKNPFIDLIGASNPYGVCVASSD